MLAKTHLALGYSSCLFFARPASPKDLIMCLGISTIFSVISDVDATTSESKKNLSKVTAAAAAGIVLILAGDYYLGTSISDYLKNSTYLMRYITSFFFLLAVCIFGEHQPHRSFMHSFAGTAVICAGLYLIIPSGTVYALISILSHIAADLLNKKKIRLFYPLRSGSFCLNLCSADGAVNRLIFIASGTSALFQTVYIVLHFEEFHF